MLEKAVVPYPGRSVSEWESSVFKKTVVPFPGRSVFGFESSVLEKAVVPFPGRSVFWLGISSLTQYPWIFWAKDRSIAGIIILTGEWELLLKRKNRPEKVESMFSMSGQRQTGSFLSQMKQLLQNKKIQSSCCLFVCFSFIHQRNQYAVNLQWHYGKNAIRWQSQMLMKYSQRVRPSRIDYTATSEYAKTDQQPSHNPRLWRISLSYLAQVLLGSAGMTLNWLRHHIVIVNF